MKDDQPRFPNLQLSRKSLLSRSIILNGGGSEGVYFIFAAGLCKKIIHSCRDAFGPCSLICIGGYRNNRNTRIEGSDSSCSFYAVHNRHINIHQDQVKGFVPAGFHSFKAVGRNGELPFELFHVERHQLLVHEVIFLNQDIHGSSILR